MITGRIAALITIAVATGLLSCGCGDEWSPTTRAVVPPEPSIDVRIQPVEDAPQGEFTEVSITSANSSLDFSEFDFLIRYDPTKLTFSGAELGQAAVDCEWEYFEYRQGIGGDCGGEDCPPGVVRLVAIADTDDNPSHPSRLDSGGGDDLELARLLFLVDANLANECASALVRWIWYDSLDNTLTAVVGEETLVAHSVRNFNGSSSCWAGGSEYPTMNGLGTSGDFTRRQRAIDFYHGGIDIECGTPEGAWCDLDLNGQVDISDLSLYATWTTLGLSSFTVSPVEQIAVADVDGNGISPTLADLRHMVRWHTGGLPYTPAEPAATAILVESGTLSVSSPVAWALVTVDGDVEPVGFGEVFVEYSQHDDTTRILVYSDTLGTHAFLQEESSTFVGEFLQVEGEIVHIDMMDAYGGYVRVFQQPSADLKLWNEPSPFDETTEIVFPSTDADFYRIVIVDFAGRVLASLEGPCAMGATAVEWDASGLPEGAYMCRLHFDGETYTRELFVVR